MHCDTEISRKRSANPSIGHKGMRNAVNTMAVTAAQLVDDPTLLAQAKVEFNERAG